MNKDKLEISIKDGIVISDYMQVTELGNYEKPI
jgi:hypothetical protein